MSSAPRDQQSIPWHRRMEAGVAVGVSLLVALSLGTIVFATTRAVTNRSLEDQRLAPGTSVYASFKATAVHLFRKG